MGWLCPSREQGPKPTGGLMAVSLLWATLPSCLRHMGLDSVRGREEIPGCVGLMMGSGTSKCALCRMVTYQRSPSFFSPFLPTMCSLSAPLHSVWMLRRVRFAWPLFLPTRGKMPVTLGSHCRCRGQAALMTRAWPTPGAWRGVVCGVFSRLCRASS